MVVVIGAIDGIIGANEDAMRPDKNSFSPRGHEYPVAVKHLNRPRTAAKDEDAIAGITGHANCLTVHAGGRKFGP
jgi:hypothetical protein